MESPAPEGLDRLPAQSAYLLVLQGDSTLNRFLLFSHPSVLISMQLQIWNEDRECPAKVKTPHSVKCAHDIRKTVGKLLPIGMCEC
jgi:hypothetical protein